MGWEKVEIIVNLLHKRRYCQIVSYFSKMMSGFESLEGGVLMFWVKPNFVLLGHTFNAFVCEAVGGFDYITTILSRRRQYFTVDIALPVVHETQRELRIPNSSKQGTASPSRVLS